LTGVFKGKLTHKEKTAGKGPKKCINSLAEYGQDIDTKMSAQGALVHQKMIP
jgi:hypothetical protein